MNWTKNGVSNQRCEFTREKWYIYIYMTPRLQNVNWPTNSTTSCWPYYCWCKKSCTSWGSLSIDLQGFIHPRWLAGFLPSTVPNTFPLLFYVVFKIVRPKNPWPSSCRICHRYCWQLVHPDRMVAGNSPIVIDVKNGPLQQVVSYLSNNYGILQYIIHKYAQFQIHIHALFRIAGMRHSSIRLGNDENAETILHFSCMEISSSSNPLWVSKHTGLQYLHLTYFIT